MRIYYHLSEYISHRKSGLDYVECLKLLGHTVLLDPVEAQSADCAVVHDDPLNYPQVVKRVPALARGTAKRVPWVAYAVWEGDILPERYADAMALADAVWTCSHYSRKSMLPLFPNTRVVPHVVRKTPVGKETLAAVRHKIENAMGAAGTAEGKQDFLFFSLVDSVNPRKNVRGLIAAFAALAAQSASGKGRPWLVLKQYRKSMDFAGLPGVISIDGHLSDEEIAALHIASDAYVSAHHAEGWGLGLSDAMAYGKPVIATGYSGNMDFMNGQNSLPVAYDLVPVSAEMCERIPLFTPSMRWAEPRPEALVRAMALALEGRLPPDLPARAAETARAFSPEHVAKILAERITEFLKEKKNAY